MNYLMNLALDMTGMVILLLMLFNFGNRRYSFQRQGFDDRLFNLMILINIALLIADMFSWVCNGAVWPGAHFIHILGNTVYYMLQPLMCLTWMVYCEYKLTENLPQLTHRILFYAVPALISEILVIANCFTSILFSVSAENIYSRCGGFYILYTFLNLTYILYALLRTIRFSREESRKKRRYTDSYYFLMVYPLFPCIGFLVQSLLYGIAVIWTGSVISLLIIYSNLQNAQITTDALTGLNNRYRFQSYINYKLTNRHPGAILYMLMIDIDRFKDINDKYGHLAGDETIRTVAQLIIRSVHRSDFVARIGGDEFIVIGERGSMTSIQETIQTIEEEFSAHNQNRWVPYQISISIGCSTLEGDQTKTTDMLLAEADKMMYVQKQAHHQEKKLQSAAQ